MKWAVTIAVGPVDESARRPLISNLPPETFPVFVGREEEETRLALVQLSVEASSNAEATALGLEILNKAATGAGWSLKPEVRSVQPFPLRGGPATVKNPKE